MALEGVAIAGWLAAVGALRLLAQLAERNPTEITHGFACMLTGAGLIWRWRTWAYAAWREEQAYIENMAALVKLGEEGGENGLNIRRD